jgi:hypothetical protein
MHEIHKSGWVAGWIVLVLSFSVPFAAPTAFADSAATADAKEESAQSRAKNGSEGKAADRPVPIFVPRGTGAPLTRLGGATRGISATPLPTIDALVPEEMGYTLDAQPSLFFALSNATEQRVDFVLVDDTSSTPRVEVTLDGPLAAGVHRIDLAAHAVKLEPGVTFLWTVALVPDPERRSQDRISGGAIARLDASEELQTQLSQASSDRRAFVLAEAGIWYDAISDLSRRIGSDADSAVARSERAALLEQVGLARAAKAEREGL